MNFPLFSIIAYRACCNYVDIVYYRECMCSVITNCIIIPMLEIHV